MSAFRQARCGLQQTSPAKVICFDASPDPGPEFGTVAGKGLIPHAHPVAECPESRPSRTHLNIHLPFE